MIGNLQASQHHQWLSPSSTKDYKKQRKAELPEGKRRITVTMYKLRIRTLVQIIVDDLMFLALFKGYDNLKPTEAV